eukprot:scaffold1090_cov265-Pinguiococcus_pyrenoidosus.AAC.34
MAFASAPHERSSRRTSLMLLQCSRLHDPSGGAAMAICNVVVPANTPPWLVCTTQSASAPAFRRSRTIWTSPRIRACCSGVRSSLPGEPSAEAPLASSADRILRWPRSTAESTASVTSMLQLRSLAGEFSNARHSSRLGPLGASEQATPASDS